MADFTIHIRGVGVYVANSSTGGVTEILFPQAERNPPDGKDHGSPLPGLPRRMEHADKSKANEHFAGALVMRGHHKKQFDLNGRRVQLSEESGGGQAGGAASIEGDFLEMVPPLADIIGDSKHALLLLSEAERQNPDRVALRLIMDAGTLQGTENTDQLWIFDKRPGARQEQDYYLEGQWTIPSPASGRLVFDVLDLKTNRKVDTIELDEHVTEVFIFNFDKKHPSKDDLRHKEKAKKGTVDDDFKWVYKLFEKDEDFHTWQDWMMSDQLPAPTLFPDRTVSVSTCFETVWTGEDAT